MIKYLVVFEKAGNNYTAHVPDLPGCFAAGATISEARDNIRKVIRLHIRGIVQRGDPLSEQIAFSEYVEL